MSASTSSSSIAEPCVRGSASGQIAPVLAKLLGVRVGLTEPGGQLPGWTGTVLHLGTAAERGERLTWLASAIESFLLQPQ